MKRPSKAKCSILSTALVLLLAGIGAGAFPQDDSGEAPPKANNEKPPARPAAETARPALPEARARAALMHDAMHATLQIVHYRYYREDEGLPIPAATLKRVFGGLAKQHQVELRWLAVDGQAMNVNHEPQTEFERKAAQALSSGKSRYEIVDKGIYRRVGAITLKNVCLKCHLPDRRSTEDRTAGLIISIPIQQK